MRSYTIAPVFTTTEFFPLSLLDLPGDGGKNHIALELHTRLLQRSYSVRVTHERALHVVNAEAVDHAALDHGVRFVSDSGQKIFLPGVGGVHVAVEHEAAAVAGAFPAGDHVGTVFFDLLPSDLQAHALPGSPYVFRHLAFITGGTGDINDVA